MASTTGGGSDVSIATMWAALGEDASALERVRDRGAEVPLVASVPVGEFVHDAIAVASLSAGMLAVAGTTAAPPEVNLDPARVATAVTSERHFRLNGEAMDAWAELSGFWRAADGWVRTHANYPHHRARLLRALGLGDSAGPDDLVAALSRLPAAEIENVVCAEDGIATVVRSEAHWREHPQAVAVAAAPLVRLERVGDGSGAALVPRRDAPLAGLRVLDLTRVIAGPVASRTLALWGADVLRVDPPGLPEVDWQHLDTGTGKRSTVLAADDPRFGALLDRADVVITGYRPGALDRFGLSPDELAERRPGLVVARLSAWGWTGPLAARRGFDSIVQAASGVSWIESADGERPGALPAQALDHAAGYLLAAAVTSALRRRIDQGGSWVVETSLARVAQDLLARQRRGKRPHADWTPTVSTRGDVTTAAAAPHYQGAAADWAAGPVAWGSSQPEWVSRSL